MFNHTIIEIDHRIVSAKWFLERGRSKDYSPNELLVKFVPKEGGTAALTAEEELKQQTCLDMFFEGCENSFGYFLNPEMFKTYQENIRIGSLKPDYFMNYFSSCSGGVYSTKIERISFDGNEFRIECPRFTFEGFENLPPFNNDRNYAKLEFFVSGYNTTSKTYVKIYFDKLSFSCNPINHMVSIYFSFSKEIINNYTEKC